MFDTIILKCIDSRPELNGKYIGEKGSRIIITDNIVDAIRFEKRELEKCKWEYDFFNLLDEKRNHKTDYDNEDADIMSLNYSTFEAIILFSPRW